MNRLRFYNIETVDDVPELDLLSSNLSRFEVRYPVSFYRVQEQDLLRPDLISTKAYQTVEYWWLILYYNEILDPFNDMEVGQLIVLPHIQDIYDWQKKYRLR